MKINIILFLLILSNSIFSQTHISGDLNLNIQKGIIDGNITITKIPRNKKFSIILHKGLNIKFVKNNGEIVYPEPKELLWGNNVIYDLHSWVNDKKTLDSLTQIEIVYSGKFPTYNKNEEAADDDMGVVAIKNGILRSTFQYPIIPILMESETLEWLSMNTYNLNINCNKRETVYLNGSEPKTGKKLQFINNTPTEFLLYAGKFKTIKKGNLILLNTELDEKYISILSKEIDKIRDFYTYRLKQTYDEKVIFPQIFSIGPKNQYSYWGFTVSPTIVMDFSNFKDKVNIDSQTITDFDFIKTIAHEMAHKYFGGTLNALSTKKLWVFYHESIAQYLAFKYIEEVKSEDLYNSFLNENTFTENYKTRTFPNYYEIEDFPLDLTNASYDYYYLYLIGFEKLFGKNKTYSLLRKMLENANKFGNGKNYFRDSALEIGLNKNEWETFDNMFLKSNNCINLIRK